MHSRQLPHTFLVAERWYLEKRWPEKREAISRNQSMHTESEVQVPDNNKEITFYILWDTKSLEYQEDSGGFKFHYSEGLYLLNDLNLPKTYT